MELHRVCSNLCELAFLLMKRASFELVNPYLKIIYDRGEHLMYVFKEVLLTSQS